jgi:imidazolonepropionase-like amidohydrolase
MRIISLLVMTLVLAGIDAQAQTTAITGATVHTVGPQGTIENATVVIENGTITAVGTGATVPTGAERIDASGKIITPGLFSPLGQIGLSEVGAVAGTNDAIQQGQELTAGFDVAEAFNPRSIVVAISRIDGVTRAGLTPRPGAGDNAGHVLSGLASVVDLGHGPDHFTRRGALVVANLGETGSEAAGGSRAAAVQVLRTALEDAIDYRDNKAAYERGDWRDYSVGMTDLDALLTVIDGSAGLLFRVNRASDISVVLELAGDYGIRAVIAGGKEAWMVADDIAAAQVPVILDGVNNLPADFDAINARLDSASLLQEAGVLFAFGAGVQTHNARLLTQSAGNGVANGLTWDQALRAITLSPAEIYGVAEVTGSIEVGKAGDIVIWGDDPLEVTSYPDQVFVRGHAVPMESRQTLLRDRYLQSGTDKPPAFRP